MNTFNKDIDEYCRQVAADEANSPTLIELFDFHSLSFGDGCDAMALRVATRFLSGELEYWSADWVMNNIWALCFNRPEGTEFVLPDLLFEIYDAFDVGEYDHRDGKDPVATRTVPRLNEILVKRKPRNV